MQLVVPENTYFYKKVALRNRKTNVMLDNTFAVLELRSTAPGVLCRAFDGNEDFKLRVPSAVVRHVAVLFSSKEMKISGTGKTSKKGHWIDAKYYIRQQKIYGKDADKILGTHDLVSFNDSEFKYTLGTTVKPVNGFDSTDKECAPGIHGFLSAKSAVSY